MSMSITPTLETSSAPASTATLAQTGPVASAMAARGAGKRAAPRIAVRPRPIRRDRRGASGGPGPDGGGRGGGSAGPRPPPGGADAERDADRARRQPERPAGEEDQQCVGD